MAVVPPVVSGHRSSRDREPLRRVLQDRAWRQLPLRADSHRYGGTVTFCQSVDCEACRSNSHDLESHEGVVRRRP
jgi:hypothetical protein